MVLLDAWTSCRLFDDDPRAADIVDLLLRRLFSGTRSLSGLPESTVGSFEEVFDDYSNNPATPARPDHPAAAEPERLAALEPEAPAAAEPEALAAADRLAAAEPERLAVAEPDCPAAVEPERPIDAEPDAPADAGGLPLADLSEDGLFDSLAQARRDAAAQGRQILLIVELAHRRSQDAVTELTGRRAKGLTALSIGARAIIEEVAQELALSTTMAGNLVETAMGLASDTPETLSALVDGDIDLARASTILGLVQVLIAAQTETNTDLPATDQTDPDQLGRDLEDQLLPHAGQETLAHLKAAGEKAQITANPRAAEFRHRRARARRYFSYTPDTDSMARLGAYLPADQGLMTKNALTRLAYHHRRHDPTDTRTLDQLRVDLMVETLTAATTLHPQQKTANPTATTGTTEKAEATNPIGGASENTTPVDEPVKTRVPVDESLADEAQVGQTTVDEAQADQTQADQAAADPAAADQAAEGGVTADEIDLTAQVPTRTQPTSTSSSPGGGADSVDSTESADSTTATPDRSRRLRCDYPTRGTPSRPSPADPQITITISAETLTGANDHPAHLHGHGPIIASMARTVAATGTWRCAVTDPDHGTLMGLGTKTYTPKYVPSQKLRRHLLVRDRVCRVPKCNRPAYLCDVDHREPWPRGATCECDTECLCQNHHKMKHETGFTLTRSTNPSHPPGTLIWAGSTGRQYPSYPAVLRDPHPRTPQEPDGPGGPGGPGECPACEEADLVDAEENRWWEPTADPENAGESGTPVSRLRPSKPIVPSPMPPDGEPPPF